MEGTASGHDSGFGISPTYEEINWAGLSFTPSQFESVTSLDPADWKAEIALHTDLFTQLAHHLPAELVQTKAELEQRLAA
jgi:phosphoenolpyruvate carboxykinase (GTP)